MRGRIRPIVNDCHTLGIVIRFVISVGFGQLITWLVVDEYLWRNLLKRNPNAPHLPHTPTKTYGLVERLLFMTALMVGASQFIAVWLVVKAAVRWRNVNPDPEHGTGADVVWLTGTGLNLLTAFVGAWFSLLRLPLFKGIA